MQKSELIVFDFDETLIATNTFRLWCKWLLKNSLLKFDFLFFLSLMFLLLKRKFTRTLSHEAFKLKLITITPIHYHMSFAAFLSNRVPWNTEVVKECIDLTSKCNVIVSSAAPQVYLEQALVLVGIEPYKIIGCSVFNGVLKDNYKSYKADNLLLELKALNKNKIDVFYTDSLDDSATMNISEKVNFIIYKDSDVYSVNQSLFEAKVEFLKV